MATLRRRRIVIGGLSLLMGLFVPRCKTVAQSSIHQTPTLSALQPASTLSYRVSLREVNFGNVDLPTLHSYAAAQYDGKWIMLAGRTNGLHSFEFGPGNFPAQYQNRDVWVIDPVAKQSWRRSLGDPATGVTDPASGLTPAQIAALTPTNNQFVQQGDLLYAVGGYGARVPTGAGTFDTLSAVDLPGLIDWVVTGNGQAIDHIRQISDPVLSVTGGAMYEMDGRMHLVFGQDFQGNYNPIRNGTYTNQVRSFDIVDDGVDLSLANIVTTTPDDDYRRRDLNAFPVLSPDGNGGVEEGLVVLSGVFTPSTGAWTVPVEIDATGNPTMADPNEPATFKQGFNGYHSAKLGLYSTTTGAMHELLFGGIGLQYLDPATGQPMTDDAMPFVNDITVVVRNTAGAYSQHHLGFFPEINDPNGKRLRFGANAEFFPAEGIARFENGVIDLDQFAQETTLGYIYGGLTANGPHTRGVPDVLSAASNRVFEVVFRPVPEPSASWAALIGALALGLAVRRR